MGVSAQGVSAWGVSAHEGYLPGGGSVSLGGVCPKVSCFKPLEAVSRDRST